MQRPHRMTIRCFLCATGLLVAAHPAPAAEKLVDLLRSSKWDRIIGTWVDAETKGTDLTATYVWKLPDRVIEITTKDKGQESVALMGVNGTTGDIFHMGADSDGASSLGKWQMNAMGMPCWSWPSPAAMVKKVHPHSPSSGG